MRGLVVVVAMGTVLVLSLGRADQMATAAVKGLADGHDFLGPSHCLRRSMSPRPVYSWSLPGEKIARTCVPGEKFIDSAGHYYECWKTAYWTVVKNP